VKGEIIQKIYNPEKDAEWVFVKTNYGLYSVRLGGFKREQSIDSLLNHKEVEFPYSGRVIEEIYSDEEWVYLILSGDGVIACGWIDVSFSGDMKLGVKFTDTSEYEPNFFQASFFSKLIEGDDGWSKSADAH
jgi:hypothetical protein